MISTYNILGKMENPLCVTVQRSAGFFYFATVKLGNIQEKGLFVKAFLQMSGTFSHDLVKNKPQISRKPPNSGGFSFA